MPSIQTKSESPLKVELEPTPFGVQFCGVHFARVWKGHSPDGGRIFALVALMAVHGNADQKPFREQLLSEANATDLEMITVEEIHDRIWTN